MAGFDRDYARISEEISQLEEKLSREAENAEKLEANKGAVFAELNEEKDKLSEKVETYNLITEESLKLSEIIEDAKNMMYTLHSEASAKRSEAKSMESYKESLVRRKEQILSEGAELEESNKVHKEAVEKTEALHKANLVLMEKSEIELEVARAERISCSENIKKLNTQAEDIRIRGSQITARKKTIEEMENNYEGYNGAVRFIMKSNIKGIDGVLAELMKVPAGLEIAVETALGGALQNIVCERDSNAKEAINLLKTNKAGRLTFLPVESIKSSPASISRAISGAPGFRGLASDLIEYDDKYREIFRYLLGRVAIVDSMDRAVALSKAAGSGLRFVTLDGEIINASGAITGGKYKNATANLLARRSEIEKLTEEAEALKKEYRSIEEKLSLEKNKAEELAEKIDTMETRRRDLEIEAADLSAKLRMLENSGRDAEENTAKKERELAAIEQDYANAVKLSEDAFHHARDTEAEIIRLNEEINTRLEEYEKIKEKVNFATEEITSARIAKTDRENKYDAICQLLDRVQESIDDFTMQIDERKDMLEVLEQEKNKLIFNSEDVGDAVKALAEEKSRLEDYIARIAEEKSALVEELNALNAEYYSVSDSLNAYQDQKYQQEIKLAKNETQLDTIKEKLWDEFEISFAQALEFKKDDFSLAPAVKESREIRNRMRELGDINVGAIREYEQVSERYGFLTEQRADIIKAMDELKAIIDDMEKTIKTKFKENFDQVVVNFEDIFKELFGGGHAELRLDDDNNPLEAGIEIIAQPPGKKLQNINLMSGGEKTMTAIALMFAVLKTKPTPFCILDEVEAALDDVNIDRFAGYLRKFHDIQFAIVTHQKATMEHADVLYGVTMPEQGISKVLSLRLGDKIDL